MFFILKIKIELQKIMNCLLLKNNNFFKNNILK